MIYSMTAYARQEEQNEYISFICEMRSINNRYLDLNLHLPEPLRVFEMPIREKIRQFVKRGKIECLIRYQSLSDANQLSFKINTAFAKDLCVAAEKITGFLTSPHTISATEILRFPGVLETQGFNLTQFEQPLLHLVEQTAKALLTARGREGEELKRLFLQRMTQMQHELSRARTRVPQVMIDQRERLLKRFEEAKLELDAHRLEQEMVLFAQRMDVSEEIERAETHLQEMHRILSEGGIVGRRLDFLLQELNREANTLGSKSTDSILTQAAIELKVLIEQIREQVQNVE